MSHLLHLSRLKSKAVQRGATPLILEYQVSADTAPYLVSSSSSVLWIHEPLSDDIVRAAVRPIQPGAFFTEVIEAVAAMGRQAEWGNVHPLTREGIRHAIEHVAFYDLNDLELLVPRLQPVPSQEDAEDEAPGPVNGLIRPLVEDLGLPLRPSSWLPSDCVVVVPKDRAYVGTVSQVTPKSLAGVVHNAARGIGIAWGLPSA